jgi:hypothetical protein
MMHRFISLVLYFSFVTESFKMTARILFTCVYKNSHSHVVRQCVWLKINSLQIYTCDKCNCFDHLIYFQPVTDISFIITCFQQFLKHVFGNYSRCWTISRHPVTCLLTCYFNDTVNCEEYMSVYEWLNECRTLIEWYWQEKMKAVWVKPVPVPLCPPQVPHKLAFDWTRPLQWEATGWPTKPKQGPNNIIKSLLIRFHFCVSWI